MRKTLLTVATLLLATTFSFSQEFQQFRSSGEDKRVDLEQREKNAMEGAFYYNAKPNTAIVSAKATASATYTAGDIATLFGTPTGASVSTCPGLLTVNIPAGAVISGVDVVYQMTTSEWMSEQRSRIVCTNPGGVAETNYIAGVGGFSGTYSYNRTNLSIANAVVGGGDITFEMHAFRTYGGTGCGTTICTVDDGTWTVTVNYFIPLAVDAGVSAIVSPVGGYIGNYDVIVTLKNFGTTNLTACNIDYDIEGNIGTYAWTGNLALNATENVTISSGYGFTTPGDYVITASANLTDDEDPLNDEFVKTVSFFGPFAIPMFEGFENDFTNQLPVGAPWGQQSIIGTQVWTANSTLVDYNRAPRTGTFNAYLRFTNTDWLFAPVTLEAGKTYNFSMWARQDGAVSTNANITVMYGLAANETAMTESIVATTGIINGGYQEIAGSFTPATGGTFYLGIKGFINGTPWYISIDDISITEAIPTDVGITAITAPASSFYAGAMDVIATLKNFGSVEVTDVNIDWDINGTTGSYNWTGTLAGGATTNVTVTNFNFATAGEYIITIATDLGGDANAANDEFTKTVNVFSPFSTPYVENFNGVTAPALPALWSIENGNADANVWITSAVNAYSAPNAMAINYNGTLIMNDWAFSPLVALETGKTYKLSFYYRARSANYAEKLKVHLGTAAGSANMEVDPLVDLGAFTNITYSLSETTFTVDADGNYCFGFHGYSDPDKYTLYFDNVSVVELYNNDVEVKSVIAPAFAGLDVPVDLGAVVSNPGLSENTFDVTVTVYDEIDADVYTNTQSVTLEAGQQLAVTLGEWIPAAEGTFSIEVDAILATDQNMSNNFAAKATDVVEGLLWGWNIDVTGSTSGIVATNLGALANGLIETADDFILPAGEWKIDSIATNGFKTGTTPDPTNFKVIVYANNAGAPGDVVYEAIVPITNPTHQQLVFEEPLILEGGHYWLVVAGNYPTASALTAGRWNWYTMAPLFYGQAMLRDNPNVFGAGATNWTALTTLGVNQGSTDFAVWGIPYVAYNVTVNVNPAGAGLVEGQESWDLQIEQGTEIELTAAANEGFLFVNWTDGEANVMGIDATLTHTVVADIDVIANFRDVISATINPTAGTTEMANPADLSTVITWNDATMVSSIVMHDPSGDWELEEGFDYEIVDIDGATAELTFNFSEMFNKKGVKAVYDLDFEIFFDLGEPAMYTLSLDLGTFVVVEFNVTDAATGSPINDATLTIEGDEYGAGEYVDVFEPGTYSYSVARDGYNTFEGTFVVVDENLMIDVELELITYNVTFSVMGDNGALLAEVDGVEIMSGDAVLPGKDINFTATPDNGYQVKNWYLNDQSMGFTTTTFNVNDLAADVDVKVEFEMIPVMTYTVTFIVADGESNPITDAVITFDGVAAAAGEYVFTDVEAGTYEYSVAKEGFVVTTGSVVVIDEDVVELIVLIGDNVTTGTFANFSAYPNPFSNQISISNAAVVSRVTIANIIGQNVLDIRTNGAESVVTTTLPAGVYLVTFEAANGDRLVRKMVKK